MSRNNISIQSSGDPEKDRKEIERFERSSAKIADGMCPNGCGPMFRLVANVQECPKCHFSHHKIGLSI